MELLGLSLLETSVCLLGVAAGGFLRGFLGFGAALLIVPVLSLLVTPLEAIAILVLIELPNIVYLTPRSLKEFSLKTVCLLYTSPSPRDVEESRMPSSA